MGFRNMGLYILFFQKHYIEILIREEVSRRKKNTYKVSFTTN